MKKKTNGDIVHLAIVVPRSSKHKAISQFAVTYLGFVYGERLFLQYEPFSEKDETCKPLFLHANHPSSYDMGVERCLGVAIGRSAYPSVISRV